MSDQRPKEQKHDPTLRCPECGAHPDVHWDQCSQSAKRTSKPIVYCPDDGTWPIEWPSELVSLADYERLRAALERAHDRLQQGMTDTALHILSEALRPAVSRNSQSQAESLEGETTEVIIGCFCHQGNDPRECPVHGDRAAESENASHE